MNDIQIGIIGGTGGIGQWFADFFRKEGYGVYVSGRYTGLTVPEIAARCQIVIVAVPIEATADVIRRTGPYMGRDQLLMDLTSLKEDPVAEMLKASVSEVVGCHPLFGPDITSIVDQNVVLCPGRGERWLNWIGELLEKSGARVIKTTPRHHDEMMSIVQGLTHITTMAMGLTLQEMHADPAELDRFSTPIFRAKERFMEKVFRKSPGLYVEMIMRNSNSRSMIDIYGQMVSELRQMVADGDAAALKKRIQAVSNDQ